ncbi:hypothetical protein [Desulfocicer niacini]
MAAFSMDVEKAAIFPRSSPRTDSEARSDAHAYMSGEQYLSRSPEWHEFHLNGHFLPDTTNIENAIMPPPPDGQWARPGTADGSIGRFLLPIGGALLRLPESFVF